MCVVAGRAYLLPPGALQQRGAEDHPEPSAAVLSFISLPYRHTTLGLTSHTAGTHTRIYTLKNHIEPAAAAAATTTTDTSVDL